MRSREPRERKRVALFATNSRCGCQPGFSKQAQVT
jgi:hypothetical protein